VHPPNTSQKRYYYRFCFLTVSKFAYGLIFNTYKTIFTDRLRVFRTDFKIILILPLIFGILRSDNSILNTRFRAIKYTLMLSPICQSVVNFFVRLSIRRHTREFMIVTVWERRFDFKIFGCGKVYYSNSIIMTNFVRTLIPNCWLENVFCTNFDIENS
jgi:hypothetical protein